MLAYLLSFVPNNIIALSSPLPLYSEHKQWVIDGDEMFACQLLHYYRDNVHLVHDMVVNPLNNASLRDIMEIIGIDVAVSIANNYSFDLNISTHLMDKITKSFIIGNEELSAIKRLISQYPDLRQLITNDPIIGLYHLMPEIDPPILDSHLVNDDEIIYMHKLGKLDDNYIDECDISTISIKVIEHLLPNDLYINRDLCLYYILHNKLPDNIPIGCEEALIDYLRLLQGLTPLYKKYDDCICLHHIISREGFYNEESLLNILKRVNDHTELFNVYHNIESWGINRESMHMMISLSILHNMVDVNIAKYLQLDSCNICQRIRKIY